MEVEKSEAKIRRLPFEIEKQNKRFAQKLKD